MQGEPRNQEGRRAAIPVRAKSAQKGRQGRRAGPRGGHEYVRRLGRDAGQHLFFASGDIDVFVVADLSGNETVAAASLAANKAASARRRSSFR